VIVASATVEEVLLILKVLFLLLLYLFIWRIVRTASRDLRLPQESFILAPSGGGAVTPARTAATGALVVVKSPALRVGQRRDLDSAPITVGRGSQNDIGLGDDQYASARHARFEPRQDGVWLQDLGSSNGTFVNGTKLTHARKLAPGDVIRIGETDFRFDPQ
jgi:pSer/pThr/pTyr-binding forkhead associated (FHA) protein